MFDKNKFANILSEINSTYNTMSDFGKKASFDRTYISKYINNKLDNPPSPKILRKIANASNGITTYNELMFLCGYTNHYQDKNFYSNMEKIFNNYLNKLISIGLNQEQIETFKNICLSDTEINNSYISFHDFISTLPVNMQDKLKDLYSSFSDKSYYSLINKDFNSEKHALPLLGIVKAGYDYFASENIIGYVSVDNNISDPENCYALKITGDSMQPILYEDDIIIVHKQNDVENRQIAIILIDDEEATVKKLVKHENYIELIAFNSYYPPKKLTDKDNFKIIGKVIEGRITKIFE